MSLHILVQVVPLHLPPGDLSTERTVYIDGTKEQIEIAKQLVNEVISSEVRFLSLVIIFLIFVIVFWVHAFAMVWLEKLLSMLLG
jgi:hypothetical protein